MSTITVVRRAGMLAIAADSQTTGDSKQTAAFIANHQKILTVGESYIGIVGTTTGKLMLADYFGNLKKPPKLDSPLAIFKAWTDLHRTLKEKYGVRTDENDDDSLESSRIDCVICNAAGIFGVDAYRTVQEYTRFWAIGSGCHFALGALLASERRKIGAEAWARLGVEAACAFDDGTSAPVLSHAVECRL